ncbi:MAG TPA: glycosyltransferase, partial [Candidatus Tumulicola sp.]|nr:glycosyltransferase [Candidatus Tumulicola sp.]
MESAAALTPPQRRVGLDARLTRQMSAGMKTYTTELARRLPAVAPDLAFVNFTCGGNFGWDEQVRLPLALRAARLDLVHHLTMYVPLAGPGPSIITVHDLIHLRFPQYFKAKVAPYYRTVVRRACRRARRVITDDEATVADLEELLQVDPAKVRVIALGADDRFFARVEALRRPSPQPYLLYVGNHREHKNLTTLFDAWSALPEACALDLLLTGPDDFGGELQRRKTPGRSIVALGDV